MPERGRATFPRSISLPPAQHIAGQENNMNRTQRHHIGAYFFARQCLAEAILNPFRYGLYAERRNRLEVEHWSLRCAEWQVALVS